MLGLLLAGGIGHAFVMRGRDANGRWIDLSSLRGRMVVISFGSRHTEKQARAINDRLSRSGNAVVSVVDLRGVPRMAHKLALKKIRESDRPNLHHIVDEDGVLAGAVGADPRHHVDMLVVDRRGRLIGHYRDEEQLADVEVRLFAPLKAGR